MTIPQVPYEGRMSYCLIKSIQMVLAHQGHVYPLPWLECVSGEVFEFVYVRDGRQLFAIIGDRYHIAGEHLLKTLHFDYTYTGAADDDSALAALEHALKTGPVAAGMLDMGYLTYSPFHQSARGADHAIVVLALQPDRVIVHDPDGFIAVPLPLADFLAAWKRDIYTGVPYGMWQIGAQAAPPTDEMIWECTLTRARELLSRTKADGLNGETLIYGADGMRQLAADLVEWTDHNLGSLPFFNWRVSAQRCFDSSVFLREKLPQAAAIRWEECLIYGELQQASASDNRAAMRDLLERLADHETRFIAAIQ